METNNLGFFGDDPDNVNEDDEPIEEARYLTYYGEERGAMISIENSEFFSNSFCKGLISYNHF